MLRSDDRGNFLITPLYSFLQFSYFVTVEFASLAIARASKPPVPWFGLSGAMVGMPRSPRGSPASGRARDGQRLGPRADPGTIEIAQASPQRLDRVAQPGVLQLRS